MPRGRAKKKKKIMLTHSSNQPGAEGEPGDVITCDAAIADQFLAGKGATEVGDNDETVVTERNVVQGRPSAIEEGDEGGIVPE